MSQVELTLVLEFDPDEIQLRPHGKDVLALLDEDVAEADMWRAVDALKPEDLVEYAAQVWAA